MISSLENFDVREADGFDEEEGQGETEVSEQIAQKVADDGEELENKAVKEQSLLTEGNNIKVEEPTKTLQ